MAKSSPKLLVVNSDTGHPKQLLVHIKSDHDAFFGNGSLCSYEYGKAIYIMHVVHRQL